MSNRDDLFARHRRQLIARTQRAGGGSAVFNPGTLSPTLWLKKEFTGSPWTNRGSSGVDFSEATNPPTASSGDADFDGSNDHIDQSSGTLDTIFNAGSWTIAILFNADTAASTGAAASLEPDLFCDGGGTYFIISYTSSGVRTGIYTTGQLHTNYVAAATGSWNLYQIKWDGSFVYYRLNGASWTQFDTGGQNLGSLTGVPRLGANFDASKCFDGKIREVFAKDAAISDADMDSYRSYLNTTHGISV